MGSHLLWAVVGGFLAGIFIRSLFPVGLAIAGFTLLLAIAILLLGFFERSKARAMIVASVALVACAAGIARMDAATLRGEPVLNAEIGKRVVIEGVIADEPDVRDSGVHLHLDAALLVGSSTHSVHAGILALAPSHTPGGFGDRVRISGTLRVPESFDTGLGRQFAYPEYLAKDGIGYELSFAQVSVVRSYHGEPSLKWPKYWAIRLKQMYLRGQDAVLPEPEAGLAGGITVGDKRSVGPELSKDFQRDSLVHMIVLSGYNITVVINAIAKVLAFAPRAFAFCASGFVVVFFILMSGGASSAVRAGLMALLATYARVSGRVYLASRALGVVALLMVAWNPFTLVFDPSFQLSALATVGLIAFTPLFASRLGWITEKFALREIASSTLGTQLAVLPLLLYQNGTLSIVALPANLLALAPVPLAMLFSFIAALGGMIFGAYAVPLAAPAYVLLWYIIAVAKFLASLPFAAVSIPAFSAWWLAAIYALMFGGLWYLQKRSGRA